jgi:hypothetical protein
MKEEDVLAKRVLDEAFRLHTELGPGLLESVYEQVLAARLRKAGLRVEAQKSISVVVDDLTIPEAFRADLIIEGEAHRRTQIGRGNEACLRQATPHVSPSLRPETRPAPEFWRPQPEKTAPSASPTTSDPFANAANFA